ncbi:MAG: DNA repair protein RecO [Planctomycetota bacterium]|nr:DNA repair protein RecO [Planctomycetota bacterium]MDE1889297.1 DNA repair protein RecO [Planctomycetota bacterium]MDE2216099.1 DNA repair protein RecO [Planctomycetota bacterium]
MPVFKTEAIVLRRRDYSNSSQIITFYTRDYGKIHTLAKGFKRHVSRKCSSKAVDLLAYYQILFIKREHTYLHTLTEAILQSNYPLLRNNLDKYYKASYIAELVNEFTQENDPSEQLFDVFSNTLTGISIDEDATIRMLVFEIKLLKILGYLPEWRRCVNCKNSIQHLSEVLFSAKEGGVLCRRCQSRFKNGLIVSTGAMLIADRLADIQKLERVRIQLPICVEIEKALRYYITSILNKELISWKYLNTVAQ